MPRYQIIAALLTPFSESGAIDGPALRAHVEWLARSGIDGLMVAGTTGEGLLLTDEETITVVREAVATSAGRLTIYAHVGGPATTPTAELASRCAVLGADAITAVCPFYYPLSQQQLVSHFETLIERVPDAPVFAYNIPRCTVNDLDISSVEALARAGLRGVKDSTRDLARHRELTALASELNDGFQAFMGSDGLLVESFQLGGAGIVSAMANVVPDLIVALRTALDKNDPAAAELVATLAQRRRELADSPVAALKRRLADSRVLEAIEYPTAVRAPLSA